MTPPSKTAEQYERWHVRDCARCGRRAAKAANWEGPICRTCYAKAVHTRGPCPDRGADRLLPGRRDHATPICRDCAGITRDFFCDRCRFEGHLHTGRLCTRCTLSDLTALTGNPHRQLLRQFGLWHQIPRLRVRAGTRPLTGAAAGSPPSSSLKPNGS
jgi:hypothetical protein